MRLIIPNVLYTATKNMATQITQIMRRHENDARMQHSFSLPTSSN